MKKFILLTVLILPLMFVGGVAAVAYFHPSTPLAIPSPQPVDVPPVVAQPKPVVSQELSTAVPQKAQYIFQPTDYDFTILDMDFDPTITLTPRTPIKPYVVTPPVVVWPPIDNCHVALNC